MYSFSVSNIERRLLAFRLVRCTMSTQNILDGSMDDHSYLSPYVHHTFKKGQYIKCTFYPFKGTFLARIMSETHDPVPMFGRMWIVELTEYDSRRLFGWKDGWTYTVVNSQRMKPVL